MINACSVYTLISAINQNGFRICFVIPNFSHFGDTVAVLISAKNIFLLLTRKIHKATATRF